MAEDLLNLLSTYPLDRASPPASENQIAAFEAELGSLLPEGYRGFLLRSGPVGLENTPRVPAEGGGSASVSALYGLGCKPAWDLRHQTLEVYPGRVPDETVPVGEDGDTGDLVLLAVDGPRRGQVFVWRHDHPEIDEARLARMQRDLRAEGHDLGRMDLGQIIHTWEHAHADALEYPPLWGNLQRIAGSFEELIGLLAPQHSGD